jgi:hypothetical protein
MRCMRERSPVDSLTIETLSMLSDMRISNSGHIDRACAGLLYAMIGNTDRVTNTEKMLKNFAFRKLPVRHRQDHHHIGAGLLRILCAPDRLCRRPVGNPDHDGHPDSDRRHRGVDDRIELRFIEVCQLAGAAQGRDCVQVGDISRSTSAPSFRVSMVAASSLVNGVTGAVRVRRLSHGGPV